MHRDDYAKKGPYAKAQPTTLSLDVNECCILLVDDVLASDRTIRTAINELLDYGRPVVVELAVLIDRGECQLPAAPDYTGERITLPVDESPVLSEVGEDVVMRPTFARELEGI